MMKLIRGELLKIRTTNTWWLFGIGVIGMTALALLSVLVAVVFPVAPAGCSVGFAGPGSG